MIRKATSQETNTLLHMTIQAMNESSMGLVKNDLQRGLNMFVPLLNSGAYYIIAIEHNQIAGWILIGPDFNPINEVRTGTITSVYVFPAFRKLGIGRQLMNSAIEELRKERYAKVLLNVYTGNPAKSLYDDLGFTDLSTVMGMNL
ncbi:GNAT family N-acetyltransferase [Metabacillus litoralis]|uniref:GNAT family N-acetyltransferase n=1 Tax=Metabacillus litoralis TaxID=152268 RepID=A0A5C6W1A4_9BACI|nr:GNAT family N-acetyltransferase [Metabacillus litoralis]TXC89535.1 GNAT family N-acetyltransferase [Metabacillus litoralis]